jgi:beta-glucuronidase
MIRPQTNAARTAIDLSGLWTFQADQPSAPLLDIAVPGSWNEQLAEAGYMNYMEAAWLRTRVFVPIAAQGQRIALRFGSADYCAQVYVNGQWAGDSASLKLPFECDITAIVAPGQWADIAVKVSAELPSQGPMQHVGKADYAAENRSKDEYWPAVRFDFFPYGGLNRIVHLVITPVERMLSYRIVTALDGTVQFTVKVTPGIQSIRFDGPFQATAEVDNGIAVIKGVVSEPRHWSPSDPYLYEFSLYAGLDQISGYFGIRSVRVAGSQLLLNEQPLALKGFGKHEDSPIHGRGMNLPLLVKDFQLLKWCGANSVRTAHYPYDEHFYELADRHGILVIDEVFSVNLDFRRVAAEGLAAHKQAVSHLIERDANHPCVIAWSLANEPGYLGEAVYQDVSRPYWEALFAHARAEDPTRPLTHANVQYAGIDDPAFDVSDFLMINRYYGWYSVPAQLDEATAKLKADLDFLGAKHEKPIFVSEFGADAMAGLHATTDQLFTEEFQADFIEHYWRVIAAHPACIGGHVWNFADFRTAQHARRVVMNLKGVFTRTRDPKRAAFRLREIWGGR